MNWDTVFQCLRRISGMKGDASQAIVLLRREVLASTELPPADRQELLNALEGLASANLYGQISLVGKLKEVLSRHAAFKAGYAEFGMRRDQ